MGISLACGSRTWAQEFNLEAVSMTSGGVSSGGDFSVEAVLGAADAGVFGGGDFEVSAGFWSAITVLGTSGSPLISLTISGGQVVLSWPAGAGTNFQLEETPTLAGAPAGIAWNPVSARVDQNGDSFTVTLPLASGNHFYRLHQNPTSP